MTLYLFCVDKISLYVKMIVVINIRGNIAMITTELKLELIGRVAKNYSEDYAKKLVDSLPMHEVIDVCKTWPQCYEERMAVFSAPTMIKAALRVLAMEILLNEASCFEAKCYRKD